MDTILISTNNVIQKIDTITIGNDSLVQKLDQIFDSNLVAIKSISNSIASTSKEDRLVDWISNDTVFTVFTTLIVFFLGILITRVYKTIEKNKDRKKLKRYFKFHLDKIITHYCKNLLNGYKDFYQNTNINSGIPIGPPKILSGDFERLNKIDTKEILECISDTESLSKIISQLDFIGKITIEVDQFHSIALQRSQKLSERINSLSEIYMEKLANYAEFERVHNPMAADDDVYVFINESIHLYYNQIVAKRDLKSFYFQIIRPLQQLLVDTNKFRTNPLALEIGNAGRKLSYKYNEFKRFIVDYRIQYRSFYNYLIEAQSKLSIHSVKINWE